MTAYAFSPSDFTKWLSSLENRSVFVPQAAGIGAWVSRLSDQAPLLALDKPRAAQSAKGFFTPAAEAVARECRRSQDQGESKQAQRGADRE